MLGVWPKAERWKKPTKPKVNLSSGGAERDAVLPSPYPCIPVLGQTGGSGALSELQLLPKPGKHRSVWTQSGSEGRIV